MTLTKDIVEFVSFFLGVSTDFSANRVKFSSLFHLTNSLHRFSSLSPFFIVIAIYINSRALRGGGGGPGVPVTPPL